MSEQAPLNFSECPDGVVFFNLHTGKKHKAIQFFADRYGVPVVDDPKMLSGAKTVLFSLLSVRDFYRLPRIAKYKEPGQEWIAGGNAVSNPVAVSWLMDRVFIGDAHLCFPKILAGDRDLPGMYDCKDPKPTRFNSEPPIHEALSAVELQMTSGCPRRCQLCAITWRRPYQEQPKERVLDFIRQSGTRRRLWLASNSSNDVSYYREVQDQLVESGKEDAEISNAIFQMSDEWIDASGGEFLVGMEGMSEPIRQLVNKPISRDRFRSVLDRTMGKRRKVRTVFQFNLPGERLSDLDDLLADVEYIRGRHSRGYWALPFIPHHVNSHTPLQWCRPYYRLEMLDRLLEFGQREVGSGKRTGLTVHSPIPMHVRGWFQELLAEWIPITPAVSKAAKAIPQKATESECRERMGDIGVDLDHVFTDKGRDYVFPWDDVVVDKSKGEAWRNFETMLKRADNAGRSVVAGEA